MCILTITISGKEVRNVETKDFGRKLYEIQEKKQFAKKSFGLWQDYRCVIIGRNMLVTDVKSGKVSAEYVIKSTNNILDAFCNKYGFNYKCEKVEEAFSLLNCAAMSMERLGQNQIGEKLCKNIFENLCRNY